MKRLLSALTLCFLAACAPTITATGGDKVSIRFNNFSNSGTTLQPLADAECAKSGRRAIFDRTTTGTGWLGYFTNLPLHAHYKCVARI